ncbi:putative mediator of RNA polymerase II transcription subunit 26c [Iris pallida]|uniref:Mediator of RNA polymerase II transcription subunit 26c n=1 Tax=Iris pallida TaxID=29817 RepID=A0AAX6IIN3_IRIPA|nr:putative mediator of RNA polymerase II transcription subunit 26c [Iris pallida]KAJ6852891.1 putative mediator of RNA polymerase II transcription subunit 26c [Iris pallida]
MDRDDLDSVLRSAGVDLWTLIETAIGVAAADHAPELRGRRDGLVERLYALPPPLPTGASNGRIDVVKASPASPRSNEEVDEAEVEEEKEEGEEQRVLAIKDSLEDPDQSGDEIAGLLQKLADMDITFKALKETDIGRHVNKMRKHPSSEVRRLVKLLVRKWKETVDEWVKSNSENATSPAIIMEFAADGDSPQQIPAPRSNQNGHQVSDISYSPNPHNGRLSSEEPKAKAVAPPRREAPAKLAQSTPSPAAQNRAKEQQKESLLDPERLASARKRLHENYTEAQNAREQRKIQVMDIHEIPKPKNGFISRNSSKGSGGFQQKHW